MKQHITPADLNLLTEAGKKRLQEWWEPSVGDFSVLPDVSSYYPTHTDEVFGLIINEYDRLVIRHDAVYFNIEGALPLLSIGQMIEFLGNNLDGIIWKKPNREGEWELWCTVLVTERSICDALWSACVEVLNKE